MATKKKAAETPLAKESVQAKVVGSAVTRKLADVKPNTWNPNAMTPFMKESLREGLKTDGWLASQALLIWGTDEKGKLKNIIIDGEHRWTVAGELGIVEGPMVFLDKLPEAKAKALTIKMNQKRGEMGDKKLGELIREIQFDLGAGDLSLTLGFEQDSLMSYLAVPAQLGLAPTTTPDGPATPAQDIPASGVRMVQLFLNEDTLAEVQKLSKDLAAKYDTKNQSDTILEALRRAHAVAFKSR